MAGIAETRGDGMKRVWLIIVALAVAGCGGSTVVIETVDAGTASALVVQQGTVVLDLRTPDEFASGHITGAVNIDFYATDFADQIGALDRGARYVVYCRSGNRSGEAMDLFRRLSFTDVHEIDGGILAWTAAGLQTTGG